MMLIAPTHGPSGDWEEARGATRRRKARSVPQRGFIGVNRWISDRQAF
jgi:hypothetical protein